MKVVGVGIDLVDLAQFTRQLDDRASGFVDSTFTESERRGPPSDAVWFGARFAAKEAALKAWSGSRFGHAPVLDRVDLREFEVVHDSFGRPALRLHGDVRDAVEQTVRDEHGGAPSWFLSMSNDGSIATAQVILVAG